MYVQAKNIWTMNDNLLCMRVFVSLMQTEMFVLLRLVFSMTVSLGNRQNVRN